MHYFQGLCTYGTGRAIEEMQTKDDDPDSGEEFEAHSVPIAFNTDSEQARQVSKTSNSTREKKARDFINEKKRFHVIEMTPIN